MRPTVVILTKNEERHIERCIASVASFAKQVVVVDSGSTDRTSEIAIDLGALVLHHDWVNYAIQFNWALEHLPTDTDWVLRLDADEIVTEELADEITGRLTKIPEDVDGIFVSRRMSFLQRPIMHGGVFPVRVLRLFRAGRGRCENRWMDEHIQVAGRTEDFSGEILDDNTNSLTWWTAKHNSYASREVIDLLNLEYRFMPLETIADLRKGNHSAIKRWFKENIYTRLPFGVRAFAYFFYRYFLRLGFLDGFEGTMFHVLQGFWYRFLVDAKIAEVKRHMISHEKGVKAAIRETLEINIR